MPERGEEMPDSTSDPIDRLLDTVRTAVNVEGDMVGSLVVQKLAGDTPKG